MTVPRTASWPVSECTAASAGAIATPATNISAPSVTTPEASTSGAVPTASAPSSTITRPPGSSPADRRLATTPPTRLPKPQTPSTKPVALGRPAASHSAGTATSIMPTPAPTTVIVASSVRTPGEVSAPASPPTRSGSGCHAREAAVAANISVPSRPKTPHARAAAEIEISPPMPATISTGPLM